MPSTAGRYGSIDQPNASTANGLRITSIKLWFNTKARHILSADSIDCILACALLHNENLHHHFSKHPAMHPMAQHHDDPDNTNQAPESFSFSGTDFVKVGGAHWLKGSLLVLNISIHVLPGRATSTIPSNKIEFLSDRLEPTFWPEIALSWQLWAMSTYTIPQRLSLRQAWSTTRSIPLHYQVIWLQLLQCA